MAMFVFIHAIMALQYKHSIYHTDITLFFCTQLCRLSHTLYIYIVVLSTHAIMSYCTCFTHRIPLPTNVIARGKARNR